MRRDWTAANKKRDQQARLGCRNCGRTDRRLELAHIIGRIYDRVRGKVKVVDPDLVVLLCKPCHDLYDAHQLDLYPKLTPDELDAAVWRIGTGEAMRRIRGRSWLDG